MFLYQKHKFYLALDLQNVSDELETRVTSAEQNIQGKQKCAFIFGYPDNKGVPVL